MHAFGAVQKAAAIARQKSWFPTLSSPMGRNGTSDGRGVAQRGGVGGGERHPLCLTFAPRNAGLDAEEGGADGADGGSGAGGIARGVQRSAFVRSFDAHGALEWRTAGAGLVLDYESVATQKGLRPAAELRADYEGTRVACDASAPRPARLVDPCDTILTTLHSVISLSLSLSLSLS